MMLGRYTLAVLWAYLAYTSAARREFGLSEMCDDLTAYFKLISQLVSFKAELHFKGGDKHLQGKGDVVFTQNLAIKDCEAHKVNSKVFITASVKDDISIRFSSRPWLQITDCSLDVKLALEDVVVNRFGMKKTRHVTLPKVEVGGLGSATVNGTELDYWSKKSLRKTLGGALTDMASEVVYDLTGAHEQLGQSVAEESLLSVLQYYLYRLQ